MTDFILKAMDLCTTQPFVGRAPTWATHGQFAGATAYCTFNGHFFLKFSIENAERMEKFP